MPPSSYPTYPGGAPTSLDTLNFSIYSLISILISASREPKTISASLLATSVLPTPVGPKKIKEPNGLSGFPMPAKLRLIDFATLSTASSCPITYFLISDAT